MQKSQALIIKIVLGFIVVFFVYQIFIKEESMDSRQAKLQEAQKIEIANGDNKKPTKPSIEMSQSQIESMESLIKKGLVAFEMSTNKVYVNPALWAEFDYKLKENMTAAFATYCAYKNGDNSILITVYDKQSGKKIAKIGVWSGYELL